MIKTNWCMKCGNNFLANYKTNVCGSCESKKEFGFPALKETVSLHTMANVSKSRVKELDKRVMLPDKMPNSDHHYIGTKERGKIRDKVVDIRP